MKYLLILLIICATPNMVDASITIEVHHDIHIVGKKSVTQVKEADSRTPIGKHKKAIRPLKSNGASPTPHTLPKSTITDKLTAQTIATFGAEHVEALTSLVFRESGFNPKAQNGSSGACGLFQAMPCAKMGCSLEDVDCQIAWGFGYIKRRYGNPSKAWAHWLRAEPINGKNVGHWY